MSQRQRLATGRAHVQVCAVPLTPRSNLLVKAAWGILYMLK